MAPRPCTWFQTNSCKKGVDCPYPHVVDRSFKRKTCVHFAQGKCRKVNDCTYSHAPDDIAFLRSTSGGGGTDAHGSANTEAHFRQWRYFFPPPDRIAPIRPLGPNRTKFCQEALELVDGEAGVMQEVITLLASEAGCARVKEIVEQQLTQCNTAQFTRIFDAQILPFLRTITHKNVTSSLILAPRLMTVYNITYGEDGQRAVTLFTAAAKHFQTLRLMQPGELDAADNVTAGIIETALTALDKLVEVNTESQVHGGLRLVVETLRQLFEDPLPAAAAFAYRPALKYLRRIEQRFGLGQALPDSMEQSHNVSHRAVFGLARERPGELSEDGPRHDNDHVDIRQISILPTLQEIQSPRNEYLPLADPREWHIGGLEGLLDRHFRLLREDTVGQLRDSAKFELERLHDPHVQDRKRQGARTFVYRNVAVSDLAFDSFRGMEFALSFDQPPELQNKSENQRRDWWEGSRRLGHEALVCLLSSEGSAKFFVVSPAPGMPKKDLETGKTVQPLHKSYNLWSEVERAHIVAKPVDQSEMYILLDQLTTGPAEQLSLVEFPGVLLPTFMPTLQAMQNMSETLDLPFAEVLAPVSTAANVDDEIDVGPPNYATKPGFRYDLSAVTKAGRQLFMTSARNVEEMTLELTTHSSLDFGQAQSVVSSLSRSLALIQGPPGTGKSYTGVQLIKILLHNKKAGDLGPIICVCYTNHALDQGLERLVDEGVKNVVRIGGNSKSERLAEVNLRAVVQRLDLTKTEKNDRFKLMKKLDVESKEITDLLAQMGKLGTEASLGAYLQAYYPEVHAQLFGSVDDDGWERVDYHRNGFFERWLRGAPWGYRRPRTVDNLRDVNITHMTGQERRLIRDAWVKDMHTELQNKLRTAMAAYDTLKKQLDAIRTELDLRVLRQANIIGVTTSGLARNLDLIRRTGAKVLVCEEAGEVLECHLLTALLPSVEHAILIGDHQQLRPHISNYSLSCESKNGSQYALDVSLFERLVKPQDLLAQALPFCTLSVQRRMHPQISQLVRRTLYPLLQDAPSLDRPSVVGMRHRLFWMDHEYKENEGGDATATESRTNDYEVDMVAALVKHLVHQGVYNAEDIAVITPYLGQLRKIRKKLGSTFNIVLNDRDVDELQKDGIHDSDGEATSADPSRAATVARGSLLQAIRVATVDNFQGEEAKVVVVSLVRCNSKNNPGFLKTSNRINVLLSRAKNGMYILGNGETMAQVDMWAEVMEIFKQDGCFGPRLELCCPRHEDTPLQVTTPEDFLRISPEAGCDLAYEVKAIEADMITFEPYGDIDLDTDPCIFTACQHIFTLSSLDGTMSLADHYKIDDGSGAIVGLKTSAEPFSSNELKVCPVCRGSLRNIARYGRIVRRALLDESARKLMVWANKTYTDLAENLATHEEQLLASIDTILKPNQEIMLLGSPLDQCKAVRTSKTGQRYRKVLVTRRHVEEFVKKLRKEEQPYQRVRDLVETARRKNAEAGIAEFDFASSELQPRERLQAASLLMRCDVVIFSDVIDMHDRTAAGRTKGVLKLDFTANRAACEDLVREARETHSVREAVEGQLLWARFAAMECGAFDVAREDLRQDAIARNDALNAEALDRLKLAEDVCEQFAGMEVNPTQGLADQISDVRRMLNAGVSTSEMTMVVAAMAREFLGTGHWYRCANGHPFTIGECGMPMELARCPACGSGIGGQNHQATEGVQHARDIETQFGGLRL
ncbi:hypothetical protein LTR91_000335 [Friedmanniomyces endolithicus]|uniref:NFX1-type zinc finger-containing protein 1 n=1 Tax=Friedmanniomyces endolithicus TaxID=329885 RepID=A0AAN6L4E0_9PEZI|nr:hypothetical protein LTR57_000801 [Friedmanniomyces endolithicus]KAK1016315.1 hypothetical protein LTR91_000335 [Friedmanniomyces endolithicus]KAK1054710.1 hypothetical protein LTS16_000355 [Friedmanniomyces endolithicus]